MADHFLLDIIAQVGILLCGASAVYLVGLKHPRHRRWGYVLGLCGQPFWMLTTFMHGQWGILAMTLFYGFSWANGLRNHWRSDA